MQGTLYKRLFERLTDLIPNLTAPREGASFYAPPRVEGDIASYCTVSKVQGSVCEVEIAQDTLVNGREQPAPWMVFRVDSAAGVAELLAMEDQWRYEVVYAEDDTPNPRRSQMNLFAVNNLTAMLNLGGAFRPVDAVEPINA